MPIEINKLLRGISSGKTRKPSTITSIEAQFTFLSDGTTIPQDYDLLHLEITKKLNQIPSAKITFRTRLTADNRGDEIFTPVKESGFQVDTKETWRNCSREKWSNLESNLPKGLVELFWNFSMMPSVSQKARKTEVFEI